MQGTGSLSVRDAENPSTCCVPCMRAAVNSGLADYTPIFLSAVPDLFDRKIVPVDVALLQMSPPDAHGYMSLGISVDIVKAAADNAALTIAQINANMPRVHGDTFFHIRDIDFIIPRDEPLIEFEARAPDDITQRIGKYVSQIVRNGDTIQVGYEETHTAEVAFVVRDEYQNMGIGRELLTYLTQLARKNGLHGFTAEVLRENEKMLHLFENTGFAMEKSADAGTYELKMSFRQV
jgi:acyl-CoA hydrolase